VTPGQALWRRSRQTLNMIPELRFLHEFVPGEPSACWPWRGPVNIDGYGLAGEAGSAHRLIYRLFNGPIPAGLVIDHTCHNRDATCAGSILCLHKRCVNPAHLDVTTKAENSRRAHAIGRRPRIHYDPKTFSWYARAAA
jgi:hypothetical protein